MPESGARSVELTLCLIHTALRGGYLAETRSSVSGILAPNSAITGYAAGGTLLVVANNYVHRRYQGPAKGLGTSKSVEAAQLQSTRVNKF